MEKDKTQEADTFNALIAEIKAGGDTAFEKFYETYKQYIFSVVRTFHHWSVTSEEILNTALVKIWEFSKNPKPIENPYGWLHTVVSNASKDLLPKRITYTLEEDSVAVDDTMEAFISQDTYEYMIRKLSLKEREILSKKLLAECTFNEIARELKRPIASVTAIYYRALKKVQMDLEKDKKQDVEKILQNFF